MIDTDKYEGHTEGKWIYCDATIFATAKGGNEIIAEYPCWNYNKDELITKEEEANLRLMTDAPLLLAEVERLHIEVKALRKNQGYEMKFPATALVIDEFLSENRQLRKQLAKANKYVHTICQHSDSMMMDYEDYMEGEEE